VTPRSRQEVGERDGALEVREHLTAMLHDLERPSLETLSAELPVGCVDGRKPACVIGAPGGNAGLLLLLLAAVEEVRGTPFDDQGVAGALEGWLDAFGSDWVRPWGPGTRRGSFAPRLRSAARRCWRR
jgi:hypothetical protein